MPSELLTTFIQRPYVFLFLAAYLVLAWRRWGWPKTLLWLVSGYLIAWGSEISSIHNGFPYGMYKYVYENMAGELMVGGVPFFDSLSYVFLTFAGFMTACYLYRPHAKRQSALRIRTLLLVALGAFLTMLLDVIVDPVATQGEKWFLGMIHYYVYPGFYFGVPLTNFGGWFIVAFAIIGFNVTAWHAFPRIFRGMSVRNPRWSLEPLFYLSIALFQTVMAFWIHDILLGVVNTVIIVIIGGCCLYRARQ